MKQLFRKIPPKEMIEELLSHLGIVEFSQTFLFSKRDIRECRLKEKILGLNLQEYYCPNKYVQYINDDMDEKRIVTILRQLLRCYGYKIRAREKFACGTKHMIYNLTIISDKQDVVKDTTQDDDDMFIVHFD